MQVASYLRLSIGAACATVALKGLAWWLTGSVGLLADALESFVNVAGASFALAMVTLAAQPPDPEHPYGHHKAEYFSSGFEGLLILLAALAILVAAFERFLAPRPIGQLGVGLALSVASAVLNGVLASAMLRKGRAARSVALEADARHLFADVWTTAGVVAGLLAARASGWLWLDPLIAALVALNIAREALALVRRSVDGLMDHALEDEIQLRLARTLDTFRRPSVRFDDIVSRRAGQRHYVDLHMHVPGSWTLAQAAERRADVERALIQAIPGLRAKIELLPSDVEPEDHAAAAVPSAAVPPP